jgi:hypothetical protein
MPALEHCVHPIPPGWLQDQRFDLWFCCGLTAVALLAGWLMVLQPQFYTFVLLADLWVLGYQHVAATFTRLCFDRATFQRNKFLVIQLPTIILATTILFTFGLSPWFIATVYFYWQWFHTARQSWGIGQMYRRKSGGLVAEDPSLLELAYYLVPLWGILHRVAQQPSVFLSLPIFVPSLPPVIVDLVAACAVALFVWWCFMRFVAWWQGRLPLAHTIYTLTHFAMFYVGYVLIDDVNVGWVVVNIWHTTQYLVIVWLFNANRFKNGHDAMAPLLSRLSQRDALLRYILVCLALSTIGYGAITLAGDGFSVGGTLIMLIASQTLNFHHFIVDAIIWRSRRGEIRKSFA